jgi:hypothetical protein
MGLKNQKDSPPSFRCCSIRKYLTYTRHLRDIYGTSTGEVREKGGARGRKGDEEPDGKFLRTSPLDLRSHFRLREIFVNADQLYFN